MRRVKTPTVLQMEAVECGAAALGIILAYYGNFVPLEKLRIECGVSRDGSKASNVVKVARKYGLDAQGINVDLEGLANLKMPVILFWGFAHFVVLEGIKGKKVYLNDPAAGPRTVSWQELGEYFTGIALTFAPTDRLQKTAKSRTLFKAIKNKLINCKQLLLFIILTGFFLVLPGLVIPAYTKIFVDNIVVAKMNNWFAALIVAMILTVFVYGILTWLQQFYLTKLDLKLTISNTAKFLHHMLHLPIEFFSQRFVGDLIYRIQLNKNVARLLSGNLASSLVSLMMVIFFAMLMFYYDVVLTIIGIVSTVIILIALKIIYRKQMDLNRRQKIEFGKTIGITMRSLQIIETIKSSGLEGDIFSRLSGQMAKMTNVQQESGSISNVLNSIYPLVTMLTTTTVLIVGAMRVIEGDLSIGTLVAFQSLMLCFLTPVVRIATLFQDVQQLHTSIERLDDVFHYPVCGCFTAKKSKKFKKAKLSGNLLVDNISFGYNPLEEPLIKNFSCELSPGKKIALVGKTGSGKSTISKLIAGLYQPWEGKILFDGEPCFSIPRNIFISSLAMVDQEVVLFAGTVRDNITMWNETISDNRIIQAAKDACIHEDIIAKFGGYEGKVNENGNNFSGGQRQLLEIARALVVDPSILILDEATSALDAYTEQKIQDNLNRVGCACLIVAHRLSTVKYCDEIIVIDNGEIIQRGTHEQLENEKEGLYYQLIRMY